MKACGTCGTSQLCSYVTGMVNERMEKQQHTKKGSKERKSYCPIGENENGESKRNILLFFYMFVNFCHVHLFWFEMDRHSFELLASCVAWFRVQELAIHM